MEQFLAAFKQGQAPKKTADGKDKKKNLPWIEKYRPRTINDIVSQEEVIAVLKRTLEGSDYEERYHRRESAAIEFPNLLFYGPPGTGKTSAILAATKELFGLDLYRDRVLELNASDERGIAVIREKVKTFSELAASGRRPDGRPCPPFKVVILDEADSMTNAAQAALRRTMERQCRTTRFCLICNYVSRIIDPITSRCAKFRFRPLPTTAALRRLVEICEAEGLMAGDDRKVDETLLERVVAVCEGDLRRAVMLTQGMSKVVSVADGASRGMEVVDELGGVVPKPWIDRLWEAMRGGSFERVKAAVEDLLLNGYSAYQCILQLHDQVLEMFQLNDEKKALILEKIAVCDECLIDGADEYLQLMSVCCLIMRQFQ